MGGGGGGTPKYVRAYDKNGNLISETIEGDSQPIRRYTYDAWNRLVRVDRGEGGSVEPSPVASYAYNALNWRTVERVRWPGDAESSNAGYTRTRVYFFSSDWQVLDVLEERNVADAGATPPVPLPTEPATGITGVGGFTPDTETQFFWGVRDKDELLEVRSRALTNASGVTIDPVIPWTDAAVNSRYALTDANLSTAAYVSAGGTLRESRVFDSYGRMIRCLPGDLNGDGVCDDTDFSIFDYAYNVLDCTDASMPDHNGGPGGGGGNPPTWGCPADLNGDWYVDEADFLIFAASYNQLMPEADALVSGNAAGGALAWGPGWNGYWFDPATGLWLSRNRWYDPIGGRWITRDPAGYVDGMSLYLYVKGNPFLFRDPSGLYTFGEMMQIGGAFLSGAHQAFQNEVVGIDNMARQAIYNAGDTIGFAVEVATGGAVSYEPYGELAKQSGATTDVAADTYMIASRAKTSIASLTIADNVENIYNYANGEISDEQFSQGQGGNAANAVLMSRGAPTRPSRASVPAPAGEIRPADAPVTEGIYEFPDQQAGKVPYVGESENIPRRLTEHESAGRYVPGTETRQAVPGGKLAREIAEHQRIQRITGGQKAKNSPAVANKKDPIGPARRPGCGLPEPHD
ncbi:MAG: hypothetical protein KF691_15445 [Phycisphaeraceae bacterium]|nr:hypothetical protein [Phycisphaeraceae bacterium]